MATTTLVGADPGEIDQLLVALERDNLPIIAAFWRYPTDMAEGRLVIASPEVDRVGSLPVYERIQQALQTVPDAHLWLGDITAVGAGDPLVVKLRSAIPAGYRQRRFDIQTGLPDYSAEAGARVTVHMFRWHPPDQGGGG